MRVPLLFKELLDLIDKTDTIYEKTENFLREMLKMTNEINEKKGNSEEIKKMSKKMVVKDMSILEDSQTVFSPLNGSNRLLSSYATEHSFKVNTLPTSEFCIVCYKPIFSVGKKCSNCSFWCHDDCSEKAGINCHNYSLIKHQKVDLTNKIRVFIEKVTDLLLITGKQKLKLTIFLFNDGLLFVCNNEAIDFIKFYSKMTKQFSRMIFSGDSILKVTSARFQSKKYEIDFRSEKKRNEWIKKFNEAKENYKQEHVINQNDHQLPFSIDDNSHLDITVIRVSLQKDSMNPLLIYPVSSF